MYCPSCGARNLTGATACVDCGRPFPVVAPAPAPNQPPSILRRPGPLAPPALDALPRAPSSQDAPVTASGGAPHRAPVVDIPTTAPQTAVGSAFDDRTLPERPAVIEPPRTEPVRPAPAVVASAATATAAMALTPMPRPVVAAPPAVVSAPPAVAAPPAVVSAPPAVAAPPAPRGPVASPPPPQAPVAAPPPPPAVAPAPPPPVVAAPPPPTPTMPTVTPPPPRLAPPPPVLPAPAPTPAAAPTPAPPAPPPTPAPAKSAPAKSAPAARAPRPANVKLAVPGTLRQWGAAVVDGLGVAVAVTVALRALLAALDIRPSAQGVVDALHADPVTVAPLLLAIPLGFFAWHLLGAALQATPGQRLAGLRLVDRAGQKPALPRLVVRAVGQAIGGLLFWAGPAWALLVDGRRRGFGDIVAGTVAVVLPKDRGAR